MHGVLVVDKPSGPTSHDVVARARRVYGTREIGHAGTLDPMASGVLVLMIGEACKLSQYLTAASKRYLATVGFGRSTDTLDALGQTTEERILPAGWLDQAALAAALSLESQRESQVPPAVSAIQVDGERAYRAARRGQPLELPARGVSLQDLRLLSANDHGVSLDLRVSKGYYVRALARDLGAALGVPAHLAELRRVASGTFTLDDAATWPLDAARPVMPTVIAASRALPTATLNQEGVTRARCGKKLGPEHFMSSPSDSGVSAWLSEQGSLVALGQPEASGEQRVVRGFQP